MGRQIIPADLYPFGLKSKGLYEIPIGRNIKKAMQEDEMAKVLKYDPKFTLDAFDINMFQLSLRCNGMNIADIFELRNESVTGDYVIFFRRKNKRPAQATGNCPDIYNSMRAIMDKWKTRDDTPRAYLFDVYNDQMIAEEKYYRKRDKIKDINDSLKRLRWKFNIDSKLTTYVARHTWASAMNEENVNILEISKGIDHSSHKDNTVLFNHPQSEGKTGDGKCIG